VRCRRGNVREEGLVHWRCSANEVCSLLGEDVDEEVTCVAAVGDLLAVVVDPVVVELLLVQLTVPLVSSLRDVGWVACRILVELLAEEGGPRGRTTG
jgi:hypothetical protein